MENDSGMVKKISLGGSTRLRADSPKSYVGQLKKEDREGQSPYSPVYAPWTSPGGGSKGREGVDRNGKRHYNTGGISAGKRRRPA